MKPPDDPVPSGDRHMARLLMEALRAGGHDVALAARFRSRDGTGDDHRQARLERIGGRLADRLVRRYRNSAPDTRPQAWFTYHMYHKAPDWLGPAVSGALGIPYLIAEASFAPKQAGGKWARGHAAAARALSLADAVICLNRADAPCVMPMLASPARLHIIRPFTGTAPSAAAADFDVPDGTPVLLAVGMMRDGDKLASYRVLADALARLTDRQWRLIVVGDGPARRAVESALAILPAGRVHFAGLVAPEHLSGYYAAADLLVWPAIREAYGMAILEAQAAGLAVVAANTGGVPDIVRDGETGLLTAPGDPASFGGAVAALLADPSRRARMGARARGVAACEHTTAVAAEKLNEILSQAGEALT
ncbi:MAG: glycosyltransferase family 4 protein [Alphaproteobacteria bacterium]